MLVKRAAQNEGEIKSLYDIMSLLNENYIKFFQNLMSFLGLEVDFPFL